MTRKVGVIGTPRGATVPPRARIANARARSRRKQAECQRRFHRSRMFLLLWALDIPGLVRVLRCLGAGSWLDAEAPLLEDLLDAYHEHASVRAVDGAML